MLIGPAGLYSPPTRGPNISLCCSLCWQDLLVSLLCDTELNVFGVQSEKILESGFNSWIYQSIYWFWPSNQLDHLSVRIIATYDTNLYHNRGLWINKGML